MRKRDYAKEYRRRRELRRSRAQLAFLKTIISPEMVAIVYGAATERA